MKHAVAALERLIKDTEKGLVDCEREYENVSGTLEDIAEQMALYDKLIEQYKAAIEKLKE